MLLVEEVQFEWRAAARKPSAFEDRRDIEIVRRVRMRQFIAFVQRIARIRAVAFVQKPFRNPIDPTKSESGSFRVFSKLAYPTRLFLTRKRFSVLVAVSIL